MSDVFRPRRDPGRDRKRKAKARAYQRRCQDGGKADREREQAEHRAACERAAEYLKAAREEAGNRTGA